VLSLSLSLSSPRCALIALGCSINCQDDDLETTALEQLAAREKVVVPT
jgi:hypothetical protein